MARNPASQISEEIVSEEECEFLQESEEMADSQSTINIGDGDGAVDWEICSHCCIADTETLDRVLAKISML